LSAGQQATQVFILPPPARPIRSELVLPSRSAGTIVLHSILRLGFFVRRRWFFVPARTSIPASGSAVRTTWTPLLPPPVGFCSPFGFGSPPNPSALSYHLRRPCLLLGSVLCYRRCLCAPISVRCRGVSPCFVFYSAKSLPKSFRSGACPW
jgi:hypothetical protein